jgi:hypothetical protein
MFSTLPFPIKKAPQYAGGLEARCGPCRRNLRFSARHGYSGRTKKPALSPRCGLSEAPISGLEYKNTRPLFSAGHNSNSGKLHSKHGVAVNGLCCPIALGHCQINLLTAAALGILFTSSREHSCWFTSVVVHCPHLSAQGIIICLPL